MSNRILLLLLDKVCLTDDERGGIPGRKNKAFGKIVYSGFVFYFRNKKLMLRRCLYELCLKGVHIHRYFLNFHKKICKVQEGISGFVNDPHGSNKNCRCLILIKLPCVTYRNCWSEWANSTLIFAWIKFGWLNSAALPLRTARVVEKRSRTPSNFSDLPTSVRRVEQMANFNLYTRPSINEFEVGSKRSDRPINGTVTSRYQNREDGCGQWSRDILTISQFPGTEKSWIPSEQKSAMPGFTPCAEGARRV